MRMTDSVASTAGPTIGAVGSGGAVPAARDREPTSLRSRSAPKIRTTKGTLLFVAIVLAGVAWLAVSVLSGRLEVRPVLTGSMEPGFSVGGVVVAEREPLRDLQPRMVIVTHPPTDLQFAVVHRVIAVRSRSSTQAVVETRGDNNPTPDPYYSVVHGPWIYVVHESIPYVGYLALWAHSPAGRRNLMVVAIAIISLVVARTAWTRRRNRHDQERHVAPAHPISDTGPGSDHAAVTEGSTPGIEIRQHASRED